MALQRSTDGVVFQTIYTSPLAMAGSCKDMNMPAADPYYYRLRTTTGTGQVSYSRTLTLHTTSPAGNTAWQVFPTLVQKGEALNIRGLTDGAYTVTFYDVSGACRKTTARVENGESIITLPRDNIPSGVYWISLSAAGKKLPGNGKIFLE